MKINQVTVPGYTAEITIGLNKGYSEKAWKVSELKAKLTRAQQKLKEMNDRILLSTKVTLCDIVFLGQDEPSATLGFINYPKFPIEHELFKKGVIYIAKELMSNLNQNRIVIVFNDKTVMLEVNNNIDSKIKL
ncbi:hypothetical protein ITJ86_15525 [Winogradskyella sp. F6397]|uniref:Uncharacterized protein n=1 Tax=Winogradskyella marina TaxID=2785530 RepID=A0ABS0ENZ0_9FLAO|nr:hypothetical protein [Winogradskyella marina]MBF8151317.1 hypothetical protein [Winogradskyella marina]